MTYRVSMICELRKQTTNQTNKIKRQKHVSGEETERKIKELHRIYTLNISMSRRGRCSCVRAHHQSEMYKISKN